jgi:branched-chain amino acid transport system permease protein
MGACYGLFGLAVVIIYKTSEVMNFAAGEMAMFSTFVVFHLLTFYHWPFWAALLGAIVFAALLGILIEYAFLRPAKNPTLLGLIVITLGVEMLLMGFASWKWGAEQQEFSLPISYMVTYEPIKGFYHQPVGGGRLYHRRDRHDVSLFLLQQDQSGDGHAGNPAKQARG